MMERKKRRMRRRRERKRVVLTRGRNRLSSWIRQWIWPSRLAVGQPVRLGAVLQIVTGRQRDWFWRIL